MADRSRQRRQTCRALGMDIDHSGKAGDLEHFAHCRLHPTQGQRPPCGFHFFHQRENDAKPGAGNEFDPGEIDQQAWLVAGDQRFDTLGKFATGGAVETTARRDNPDAADLLLTDIHCSTSSYARYARDTQNVVQFCLPSLRYSSADVNCRTRCKPSPPSLRSSSGAARSGAGPVRGSNGLPKSPISPETRSGCTSSATVAGVSGEPP